MTTATHTPGAWKIQDNFVVFDQDGQCAQVCGHNRRANMRLIAAAPELLACLKNMVANEGYMSAEHMIDLAKLAIAKAEGR